MVGDNRPYRAERQKRDPADNYKHAKPRPRPRLSINNAKPTVPQPDAYFTLKSSHQSQGNIFWTKMKRFPICLHYTLLFPAVSHPIAQTSEFEAIL